MGQVLITGATGFLGGALATKLVQMGAMVVGMGRDPAEVMRMTNAGVRMIACDLSKPVSQANLDAIGDVSTIVHCAARSSPWGRFIDFQSANVDATQHVLAIARACSAHKVVHISSPTLYFQFADQMNLAESTKLPPPVNAYAATKATAETLIAGATKLNTVILRPRGIYGAGDTALLPRLLRVAARRPIPRFRAGQGATDITHIDDVVAAIIAAMRRDVPRGEVFNISGGTPLPLEKIITAACAAKGVTPRWRTLPFGATLRAVRMAEAVARRLPGNPEPPVTTYSLGILRYKQTLDISKAARLLGWSPQVDFTEGLRRTFPEGVR